MPGDPVVGSTILRRPAIQSPNYSAGAAGWSVNSDGSAEFNNLTIRGTFAGTDFVINSSGQFFYSPSEAAGNLVQTAATAAGTDSFGNHYLSGVTTYDNGTGVATQLDAGAVSLYTGSLAGGWTAQAQIFIGPGGVIELITPAGVITSNNTLDNGAGGATFNGTVIFASNTTTNNSLSNSNTTGTSGAASAGTAHTHGPGSYKVSNDSHHHSL
jgi:hypothetical protein